MCLLEHVSLSEVYLPERVNIILKCFSWCLNDHICVYLSMFPCLERIYLSVLT